MTEKSNSKPVEIDTFGKDTAIEGVIERLDKVIARDQFEKDAIDEAITALKSQQEQLAALKVENDNMRDGMGDILSLQEISKIRAGVEGGMFPDLKGFGDWVLKQLTAKDDLIERLKREAEFHAGEAKCHKSTVHEIYQAISGAKGEKGNWNGARPIIDYIAAKDAEIAGYKMQLTALDEEAKILNTEAAGSWESAAMFKGAFFKLKDRIGFYKHSNPLEKPQ